MCEGHSALTESRDTIREVALLGWCSPGFGVFVDVAGDAECVGFAVGGSVADGIVRAGRGVLDVAGLGAEVTDTLISCTQSRGAVRAVAEEACALVALLVRAASDFKRGGGRHLAGLAEVVGASADAERAEGDERGGEESGKKSVHRGT